jgi:hypothetical protein
MFLQLRGDGDRLPGEQGREPLRRPGALAGVVDVRQRLKGDGLIHIVRQRPAQVVPIAAHRERRGADRAPEIEGENLRARVAPELQRHQRQQHALAGASRSDDQRVTDIADMERKAERRGSFGPREEERRRLKMLIPFRPGPDRRERHHVREIERRDGRLTNIGVHVTRQRTQPRLDGVDALAHAGEIAALNGLLDQAQALIGDARVLTPDRDGRGDISLADEIGTEFLQCGVCVERLVGGVGIHQHRRLVGHHLLEDRHDALALGEPLAPESSREASLRRSCRDRRRVSPSDRDRQAGSGRRAAPARSAPGSP